MKLKNKIAILSTVFMLQSFGANAADIDDEIAVFAAEQNKDNEQVETFDPDSLDARKNKTRDEIKAEEKRLEEERKAAKKKIKEERKKSREELKGKTPVSQNPAPISRANDAPTITPQNFSPASETPANAENQIPSIVKDATTENSENAEITETPPVEEEIDSVQTPPVVSLPNPVLSYANFNEMVQALQFTPLYIPQKSGYIINSMITINNKTAEIRYKRKWEPNVLLHVRTYRRAEGEELKDISGITGVKWRRNVANGTSVYLAKISETKQAAAWAYGNYTFSAYAENLSFAAFYSLVSDELIDLAQHYYLN